MLIKHGLLLILTRNKYYNLIILELGLVAKFIIMHVTFLQYYVYQKLLKSVYF